MHPNVPPILLVADDYEKTAETLAKCLELSGAHVLIARDGTEALRLALEQRPDACILDVHLPGLSGAEVALKIRERFGDQRPRLVAITADRWLSHRQQSPFDTVLFKPSRLDDLVAAMGLRDPLGRPWPS